MSHIEERKRGEANERKKENLLKLDEKVRKNWLNFFNKVSYFNWLDTY